jgi:hypothetical protein
LILAFSDDSTVRVFDTVEQANGWLEGIDVENGEYVFLDGDGHELTPVFSPPVRKKILGFIPSTFTRPFTFQTTERKRTDLIVRLSGGLMRIARGGSKIKSMDQLRAQAPGLFVGPSSAEDGDEAFRDVVRRTFGEIATEWGASLKQIEPRIFGFCTEHAVLTIGAYPGHFRGVCVKLRHRLPGDDVGVRDDLDIGLANFEAFSRPGQPSHIYTRRERWSAEEIRKEVESLATVTREVVKPFLTDPNADWAGVRLFVDKKIEQAMRDRFDRTRP